MGFSLTWTAVRGKPSEEVLAALGLRLTGATSDDMPTRREPYASAQLDGGWVLVVADASTAPRERFLDESDAADRFLSSLSKGCEVVCCFVEEHVMYGRACAWRDGVRLWSVAHDAEVGVDDLQVAGTPPPDLAALADRAREEQAAEGDADYAFDVPVDLAKAVAGFRHDEDTLQCRLLEPVPGGKRGLLGRLFGR